MCHYSSALVDQIALLNHDSEISVQKFQKEEARVFSSQDDFEVLLRSRLHEHIATIAIHSGVSETPSDEYLGYRFSSCHVQNLASLTAFLENEATLSSERFYIFHQLHSWDRLRITHATLQQILSLHETFPALLDLFRAFGLKTREDDNSWNHFRQLIASRSTYGPWYYKSTLSTKVTTFLTILIALEFCYSVRYMEKNGRETGDPWSLRQSGVYQKVDAQTENSVWILLQPAESIRRRLRKNLEELGEHTPDRDPFRYHILILSSSLRNWNEYIVDVNRELDGLNDKACFSRIGFKKKHDFALAFSDCQKLRLTEQRILYAASALDSYIDTCTRCMTVCVARSGLDGHSQSCAICMELASFLAEARLYRQKITNLLHHSSSTATLLLKILEFRNDEAIQESAIARRTTLGVMKDIAIATKRENEGVAKLALQMAKDSKALKALTLTATIYLPATFLAVGSLIFGHGIFLC
ncbi:MAG: hypothetical protein M1839_001459 [Geoglossum umbratile]|nr:MAG: hypothetical protein M1839_001459 [Geoglossum umbratile]